MRLQEQCNTYRSSLVPGTRKHTQVTAFLWHGVIDVIVEDIMFHKEMQSR